MSNNETTIFTFRHVIDWEIQQEIAVLQAEGRKNRPSKSPMSPRLNEILDNFSPTPEQTEILINERFASYYAI